MSRTLVERLCQWAKADGAGIWGEAADRIEELEAACSSCYDAQQRAQDEVTKLQSRIEAGLELADEMERRNYSGTMDWYAEQLREALGGSDE